MLATYLVGLPEELRLLRVQLPRLVRELLHGRLCLTEASRHGPAGSLQIVHYPLHVIDPRLQRVECRNELARTTDTTEQQIKGRVSIFDIRKKEGQIKVLSLDR